MSLNLYPAVPIRGHSVAFSYMLLLSGTTLTLERVIREHFLLTGVTSSAIA